MSTSLRLLLIIGTLITIFGGCQTTQITENNLSPLAEKLYTYHSQFFDKNNNLILQDTIILEITSKVWDVDSTQKIIKWDSKEYNGSKTGYILTDSSFWIHPPRMRAYEILEFCPFPEVRKPYIIGNQWKNYLSLGDGYADSLYANFKGFITLQNHYQIKDNIILNTALGKVNCVKVVATSTSKLGIGTSTIYYNDNYGMLQLDFNCLKESRINMKLVSVESVKPKLY